MTTPAPTTTPAPILSPAALFRLVILPKAAELGFTVYVNHMQDKPDRAILVMDTKGRLAPHNMAGEQSDFPVVEVQVRAHDHDIAANVLPVLWESVLRHVTATSVGGKIMQCISKYNTMGCMGQEPQTRRWRFIQSFMVKII
jgi:hypothetical protein